MIKLAIVGTGSMANNHASAFKKIKGVHLTACCDILSKAAKNFAKMYDIPNYYTDFRFMLDKEAIDAVSIVVSDKCHAPLATEAIKEGLHVFCEKPLATSAQDAYKMAKLAKAAGVINMVNFVYRRSSALQKVQEMISDSQLGEIRHIQAHHLQSWLTGKHWGEWKQTPAFLWRLSKNHDSSGALGDIGSHILDFVTFAAGDIIKVYCDTTVFPKGVKTPYKGYSLDANDSAHIVAEFTNGATGTINVSRWATGQMDSVYLQVHGTKGAVKIDLDDGEDKLWISIGKDIDKPEWKLKSCGKCITTYEKFITSIQTGVQQVPSFIEGAKINRYLEKCFESSILSKPVCIPENR